MTVCDKEKEIFGNSHKGQTLIMQCIKEKTIIKLKKMKRE